MIDSTETWMPCLEINGYEVSSLGRVRSMDRYVGNRYGGLRKWTGRVLKLSKTYNGYMTFRTTGKSHFVHREVLKAFTGVDIAGQQCCHNNGIRTDNRVVNLRWDTAIGNEKDKLDHGTHGRGEKHATAKLSNEQVSKIKLRGASSKQLAEDYGVSPSHIRSIWCGSFRKNG